MSIMRKLFGTALLAGMLFAGAPAFSAPQVAVGIRIGPPPRPRYVRVRPIAPGPDYYWVDGYWYPVGHRYRWHSGYWTRPPYSGAVWVGPRYDGGQFYGGYWNGDRGRFEHDHRWDRDRRDRDRDRWRDHDRDDRYRDRDHDRDRDHR
jgi:hypothetical protein